MVCQRCGAKGLTEQKLCPKCQQKEAKAMIAQPSNKLFVATKLIFKDIFRYGKSLRRADYWYGTLGLFLLDSLVYLLVRSLDQVKWHLYLTQSFRVLHLLSELTSYLFTLMLVVTFFVSLSAQVRRLHDVGIASGWVLLGFFPLTLPILLVLLCQPAKKGENTYLTEKQNSVGAAFYRMKGAIVLVLLVTSLLVLLTTQTAKRMFFQWQFEQAFEQLQTKGPEYLE